MFCCSDCFSSAYLKGIINSNQKNGNCSFCDSKNVSVYNPSELSPFFQNIFDLYINNKSGNPLEIQVEKDFSGKIFSSKITSKRKGLLSAIVADDISKYDKLFKAKVVLKHVTNIANDDKIKPLQISWEKFADEIISTNRFHIQNNLDLDKLKTLLARYERIIPKGKKYFRARISDTKKGYTKKEMGNPPTEKAKAGRANPQGISYLYIGDEIETTLYEARAALYDFVTIGEFKLKEDIRVINLRGDSYDPIILAESGELEDFLIHLPFITRLEQELSKPRRRSDNELDYLPTQYLSEFIKSMGFDGVEYKSSLYKNGSNVAIFNPTKLNCVNVKVYDIEDINLAYKEIK